jgi:oligopeptide transport system substrate-binding protein
MLHCLSRVSILLGALVLLTACQTNTDAPLAMSQPAADDSPPPDAGMPVVVRIATGNPPGSLDPTLVSLSDTVGSALVENLYIGLTQLDPDTNGVAPALATDWSVSSDGLRWTFALRDDISWVAFDSSLDEVTALRPVTAEDVVYAVWRACDPATHAPHAATLFIIKGCREINNTDPALITEQTLANTIRVAAINSTSLSIELEQKAAHFPSLTTTSIMSPVAREAFAEEEAEWRDAGQQASSGPWVIASQTPGEGITLVANPEWPVAGDGNLTTVEVHFAADDASAYAAFQAGEADIAPLPGEQAQAATLLRVEPRVTFLVFATDQFPMDDVRVRRALAAAIDRQGLVDETLSGDGIVTSGFAPPGSMATPGHSGAPAPSSDLNYAKEQLAAAGYPNCQLFPRVTLMIDKSRRSMDLAQAVVQMWQNNLLCNDTRFDIQQGDMRLLLEGVNTPLAAEWQTRPQISLVTWQADYPDAANWLGDLLHCQRGYFQIGRSCELVDDLIERAAEQRGADARAALYAEAEALLFGKEGLQPIAPLFTDVQPLAVQSSLTVPTSTPPLIIGPMRYDRWQLDPAQ